MDNLVIVSNSGPILSFVRANHLYLLHEVIGELIIPGAVYEDIVIHGAGKLGFREIQQAAWIKRKRIKDRSFIDQLSQKLHLGESEAIVLAKELGAVLLVDEYEARKEALRLGIEHLGSLRVLKEAKESGLIKEIKVILDDLISTGTYISDDLYHDFLREIGEE